MHTQNHGSGFRGLIVYQKTYQVAREIHLLSKSFPRDETFGMRDQIRRSSRAVAAIVAEAYNRRRYPKAFVSKLIEAAGESAETEVWLDMAHDFGFLSADVCLPLTDACAEVQRMLESMINQPEKFCK